MKKLGKYGKKVSCVVIGMLCAAAIGACGSTQSGSQDEKDVRNDISVYEEGADLEGTLTYGTLFIEPQTQHMIDLFMKEHPGVKIETKVVFDNDVTDEQYNEGLNTLLTELASDQRADIYDATYLPSEIKTKGSGYFEDLNQYIDADPNFNRDDYYDNILRAAEVDGKLYQIPEGFYYVMLRLNRNITDELNYEVPDEMDINDLHDCHAYAAAADFSAKLFSGELAGHSKFVLGNYSSGNVSAIGGISDSSADTGFSAGNVRSSQTGRSQRIQNLSFHCKA